MIIIIIISLVTEKNGPTKKLCVLTEIFENFKSGGIGTPDLWLSDWAVVET